MVVAGAPDAVSVPIFFYSGWAGWPQTWKAWNTEEFLWTWQPHGILWEFCATSGKQSICSQVYLVHENCWWDDRLLL